jgi:bacteriorhodopsin
LFVGAITYFAMASDLGWSVIATANHRGRADSYQIFFAKYIYWVVAWPAILIALGLISGVSWATIFFNVFLAWSWYVLLFPELSVCCYMRTGRERG